MVKLILLTCGIAAGYGFVRACKTGKLRRWMWGLPCLAVDEGDFEEVYPTGMDHLLEERYEEELDPECLAW